MGRCSFARGGRRLATALSLLSLLSFPSVVGLNHESYAAGGVNPPPSEVHAVSTLDLTGLQSQFGQVVDRVAPSVVAISASCTPIEGDEVLRTEALNPQKLDAFLSKTTRTVGTGFFIDSDGFILTNEHVICEAEQLWVTTDDRRVYPAIVIGSDPRADLAVLKIPAAGVPVVKMAKPGEVKRGQWTIAIGNPYGMAAEGEMAMSVGVVSAIERSLPKLSSKEGRLYSNLIQTTAEINPGNSGGPLFNLAGEVIGINTAVILPQKQTNGIGFAIPVTEIFLAHIEQLKAGREIVYGFLGVTVIDPTAQELRRAGAPDGSGARIEVIEPKSPAENTNLKKNDVIVAVNGTPVLDSDAFIRVIGHSKVDEPAKLTLFRDKKQLEVVVTPKKRPMPPLAINRETQRLRWRGITLSAVPQNWVKPGEAEPAGVYVVGVENAELAKKLKIKQGSIIKSIAGKTVTSIADLQKIIDSTPLEEGIEFVTADTAAIATAQE
jgi:serine protease Do